MTDTAAEHSYTLKRVQELLGLSRTVVTGLVKAGFVVPGRGPKGEHRFSFQDLMLLRTARALQAASVPTQRILRSLAQLRADLPEELPLTGLRITAVGSSVAVRDRDGPRDATSGQYILDFEVAPNGSAVTILEHGRDPQQGPADRGAPTAERSAARSRPDPLGGSVRVPADRGAPSTPRGLLDEGERLEAYDAAAAEAAYRRALAIDLGYVDAYLNLGTLLCEHGRAGDAIALYTAALDECEPSALLHFNMAIALEDEGRIVEAVQGYERALVIDPLLADAHFNAARLLERLGDMKATLRHFSAYRRMSR